MSEEVSKVEKKRISILGCGWLGFPLAKRLLGSGITSEVKGSTTSAAKLEKFEAAGIDGYLLDLNPETGMDQTLAEAFFDADTVVIAIPPRMSQNAPGNYSAQMQMVAGAIGKSAASDVIFVSSTGIYPELNRIVTEEDITGPEGAAQPEIAAAEKSIESLRPDKTVTILRLSGLLGYNRIPGKYVQGKKDMLTGDIPVNYVHRDDAAAIIQAIIEQGALNATFNITAPLHPTRRETYIDSCTRFGWEAPTFKTPEQPEPFKVISGKKFEETYPYKFRYPDPLEFYYRLEDL